MVLRQLQGKGRGLHFEVPVDPGLLPLKIARGGEAPGILSSKTAKFLFGNHTGIPRKWPSLALFVDHGF